MDLWQYLSTVTRPIFLYGTGNGADKILNELERRGISVTGVFASDGFVRNRDFRGFHVVSFSEALQNYPDLIVLVCFGSQLSVVMDNIKRICAEAETYAPDVPVIGDNEVFDIEYARLHREELSAAYNLLADEPSRRVFENTVMYKITGKLDYIIDSEADKSEAYKLLNLGTDEQYLDLGAYNGDTVAEFLHYTENKYSKIIAVEPDAKNFRKLSANTENIENIILINAGISDQKGEMLFSMKGGRNSALNSFGKTIPCESVDSILKGDKITYIKMDIEGLELSAIRGAEQTIKMYKPRLNIAAYHRNEDLFTLPLLLHRLNPQYKIYLRHHPYIPAWDTNFYVI